MKIQTFKNSVDTSFFLKKNVLFCDTETQGLYGDLVTLQICCGDEKVNIIECPTESFLLDILTNNKTVWHNASYDFSCIIKQFPNLLKESSNFRFDDTLLLSKIEFPGLTSFSLDSVIKKVVGFDPYKDVDLDKKTLQKSNFKKGVVLSKEQKTYAALDVFYLGKVYEACHEKNCKNESYKLDLFTISACLNLNSNGIPINKFVRDKYLKQTNKEIEESEVTINVNSPKQLKEAFNLIKTDKYTLAKYSKTNKDLLQVLNLRKSLKRKNFLEKLCGDRLTGFFAPTTKTGRLKSVKENLHQIPSELKSMFGFEKKHRKVLVYSDFSQLELRTIALLADDKVMLTNFKNKEDLHSRTASVFFGKDFNEEDRKIGKIYNFSMLYGGSSSLLKSVLENNNVNIEFSKINHFIKKWFDTYKGVQEWHQNTSNRIYNNKNILTSFLGRKTFTTYKNEALSFYNQSFASDICKYAFVLLNYKLSKIKENVKIVNFVHDSFLLECEDNENIYKHVVDILCESMKSSWLKHTKMFENQIEMPITSTVSYSWKECETKQNIMYEKHY